MSGDQVGATGIKKGTFKIDVYKKTVNVIICKDPDEVTKEANKIFEKDKENYKVDFPCHGYTMCTSKRPTVYYILLSAKNLDINTITHETDHLRNFILSFCSILESSDAQEASANLNGFINEKVFRILTKNNVTYKF